MPTIELTDEQYAAIRNGEDITIKGRKKKWGPKGGNVIITDRNKIQCVDAHSWDLREAGRARATIELANIAAANSRARDRLEAHLHENYPNWRVAWDDDGQEKYTIFYDHDDKVWSVTLQYASQWVGAVYGPEEWAEEVCRMLNNGEMEL